MQGAQNVRSEAYLQVRRNDEGEAQRRRWPFYEAIKLYRLNPGFLEPFFSLCYDARASKSVRLKVRDVRKDFFKFAVFKQ